MKFRDRQIKFGVTGETHALIKTKSGHYALPLADVETEKEITKIVMKVSKRGKPKMKKKKSWLTKLLRI